MDYANDLCMTGMWWDVYIYIYNEKCHQITYRIHTCDKHIEFSSGQGERAKSQWLAYRSSSTVTPTYFSCPAYSASNTNSATINYSTCPITACPGDTVTMTIFGCTCDGDTYLRLYDPTTGSQLTFNDDYNGSPCSQITYSFTATCRTYELREGCYSSGSCGGQVYYSSATAPISPID